MPDAIGPYAIAGVLGEGGMGVVYRARHRATGEWCALKTASRVDVGRLALLRREIRALRRLRHPGIVRVFDDGVQDGKPWYAMELLEPITFASVLASTWSTESTSSNPSGSIVTEITPMPGEAASGPTVASRPATGARAGRDRRDELVGVLLQLCAPLALLHSEGLVHCDLKPSNVFLRADGSPVVGDFGLAAQVAGARGRDVLEVERQVRGSYAYMSPEQIRGEQVDARADLYALGCMLYEAVTGRPPFVGSIRGVMSGHLESQPHSPSHFVSDLPSALETVILRLLAKEPRRRIGFAEDVAKTLAAACGLALPPVPAGARPYVYRSTLVGRDEDMQRFRRWLLRAREGRGGIVLLGGESGVGKTRLATEVGRYAAGLDLVVVTGQCSEHTDGRAAGAPLEPLLPLLRLVADRCVERGGGETARLLGDRGPVLAAFERSLAGVPGAQHWPELPRLDPQGARRRLVLSLLETMVALAGEGGLLLVLDDLQWCDELTTAFLAMAAHRLAGTRILVLGTYRTEERAGIETLMAAEGVEHLQIGRLGERSIGAMVGDMLSMDAPSSSLVRFLTEESEGNPFFVAEYLRAAIGEAILSRDEAGQWQLASVYALDEQAYAASLPLPSSLRELVGVRLKGLSPVALAVLEAAAVLGRELDPSVLESTAALAPEAAMDGIQELIGRQVLETADERLRFLHHKLREFSYDQLAPPVRVALHRRAALAIQALAAETLDLGRHVDLARHWSLGDTPERALEHYRTAARLAAGMHANEQAIEYCRYTLAESRRLPQPAEPGILMDVHERLGDVLSLVGRQGDARDSYATALDQDPAAGALAVANLHRKIGKTWEMHHEHVEALRCFDRALAAIGTDPSEGHPIEGRPSEGHPNEGNHEWWEQWTGVRLDRVAVHYWRGAPHLMAPELELVRPHMARTSPRLLARYHEGLALLGYRRERYLLSAETVEHARRFHKASVASGDQLLLAAATFEWGFAQLFHGDLTAAADTLQQARQLARRIGDLPCQVRSLTYLITCQRRRKRLDLVEVEARQCLELAHEMRIGVYIGTSQANLAWVDYTRGRRLEVEDRCRSALDLWHHMDAAFPFFWLAALPLLAVRFARRDLSESLRLAELLLAPNQQELPPPLALPLAEAVQAGHEKRESELRAALARAITAAGQTAYL